MALTRQQHELLRIINAVDTSGVFALAGGGAINALGVADRLTRDPVQTDVGLVLDIRELAADKCAPCSAEQRYETYSTSPP